MLWPPVYQIVINLPVATLDPRKHLNRTQRRRNRYGKPTLHDQLQGRLTPKQTREAGLYGR